MAFKGRGVDWKSAFADRTHEIKTATRSVVFISGDHVSGTSLKTQAAMNAREQLLFFRGECGYKLAGQGRNLNSRLSVVPFRLKLLS